MFCSFCFPFEAPLVPSVVPPEPSGPLHPPRMQKPPVTRVKLGFKWMIPQQHELSAIQEVETPVNMSRVTGPLPRLWFQTRFIRYLNQEKLLMMILVFSDCRPDSAERRFAFSGPEDDHPSHLQEGSGFFSRSDRTLESGSVSSCRPNSAGRRVVFSGPGDDVPSVPADFDLRGRSAKRRVVFSDSEDDLGSRSADGNLQDGSVHHSRRSGPSAGRRVVFSGPEDDVPSCLSDVNLQDGSVESRVGSEASCHFPWRERRLSGAATTPELCDSGTDAEESTSDEGEDVKLQ